MVLVESKSEYISEYSEDGNPFQIMKLLLFEYKAILPKDTDRLEAKLAYGIVENDKNIFLSDYMDFSKKQPTPESDFIYNDIQIFLLICVTKKFNLDSEWLLKFVELRKKHHLEKSKVTESFFNILSDNLESKNGLREIIIVYKNVMGIKQTESMLNDVYMEKAKKKFPFYPEMPFINLIALNAIDIIIFLKGFFDHEEYNELLKFEKRFLRITKIEATIHYISLIILCSIPSLYLTYKLFYGNEAESQMSDKIFTAFPFLVLFGVIIKKNSVISFFQRDIQKINGYYSNKDK